MYCTFRRRIKAFFWGWKEGFCGLAHKVRDNSWILIAITVQQYPRWHTPVSFKDLSFPSNFTAVEPYKQIHTTGGQHLPAFTWTFKNHTYTHTCTLRIPSSSSLLRAKQALSSFNVSSSIDPLLKLLPWVGIGQIQSHTGQFITKHLVWQSGGGQTQRRKGKRRDGRKDRYKYG